MHKPLSKSKIKKLNKSLSSELSLNTEIVFILQSIEDPINVGSIFRIADGCGASVVLTGTTPKPPNGGISLTSKGLERSVEWRYVNEFETAVSELKEIDFEIIGVELTENAVAYDKYKFQNKVALVLGNEKIGIFKKYIGLCDAIVYIPMFGKGPSLNVNVAGAIVGYRVISQCFSS